LQHKRLLTGAKLCVRGPRSSTQQRTQRILAIETLKEEEQQAEASGNGAYCAE
jgi:hypothetical protein